MRKTLARRLKPVIETSRLPVWEDVAMCNISVRTRSKLYIALISSFVRHQCSPLLPCPSPKLVKYAPGHYREGDTIFKEWFKRVLEKETVEMVLASFENVAGYGIRYSRQCYLRIMQLQGYVVLTPLLHATKHIINSTYMMELFYDGDFYFGLFWLAIQRQHEVDWAYANIIIG